MTEAISPIFEQVESRLAPYLGSFNAKVWVTTVAERNLGLGRESLTASNLPSLLEGLRPSLNTFFGRRAADDLLRKILREVR